MSSALTEGVSYISLEERLNSQTNRIHGVSIFFILRSWSAPIGAVLHFSEPLNSAGVRFRFRITFLPVTTICTPDLIQCSLCSNPQDQTTFLDRNKRREISRNAPPPRAAL